MLAAETEASAEDEGDGPEGVPAAGPEAQPKTINSMLCPYGRPSDHYRKVVEAAGHSRNVGAAIIISSTAHPGHWVACVQQGLETYVYTRRWSEHSKQHGLALGKHTPGRDLERTEDRSRFVGVYGACSLLEDVGSGRSGF